MGTKFYSIVCAQNPDSIQEVIHLNGLDLSSASFVRDEHDELTAFRVIGDISFAKKIMSEKDAEDEKQKRCWDKAKVPFMYATGEFFDKEGHPNAMAAVSVIRFAAAHPEAVQPGFSVDGSILERRNDAGQIDEKGKQLTKTQAISAAWTIKPANKICAGGIFIDGDLQKSHIDYSTPPAAYVEALKKSQSTKSFNEIISSEQVLNYKIKQLKKSLENYGSGFTTLKCWSCGHAGRFFKSMSDLPNCCSKCSKQFSVSDIWNALNK